MMRQYRDAKERHPGMLLLFRMGDFFELFGDDAILAAKVIGLTLTSRDKQIPMAGFPHHQLEGYLRKLLLGGHRVAVCDQVEEPSQAKGLVKREVTRVITAGTVTEDELLEPDAPNFIAAISCDRQCAGIAWADLSAGTFCAMDVPIEQFTDEIARLSPAECLIPEHSVDRLGPALAAGTVTSRPDWTFDPETAKRALHEQFGVTTCSGLGFEDGERCLIAAGALVLYLRETVKTNLAHLRPPLPYRSDRYLVLDEVTRRSLELTCTLRDGDKSQSLFAAINRTVTRMGSRKLREWLLQPLTDLDEIAARHDAVEELLGDHPWRSWLRGMLEQAGDLERLTARVSTLRASPRDLAAVGRTLALLPQIKATLEGRTASLFLELDRCLEPCTELRQELEAALAEEAPQSPRDGGLIRDGYDAGLDDLRTVARDGKGWIARYQASEVARSGIASLKVGFNQVFGYYIEITHANSGRVPADYIRKQTLKNAERYITPELKEYEEKVLGAEEKIRALEYELFLRLRDRAAAETVKLQSAAESLASLDVIASLAELAGSRGYVRPELVEEPVMEVIGGRHPVLEQTLPAGTFVPNNIDLTTDSGRFWLITGPNMAGKSIFIRQCALLTLLAQTGSFVPATSAKIGIADRIFTRVGASDELSRGQSTFMVEMVEAANILNNATPNSLVILDEIGRGTSTFDGVSLAWAITEFLHDTVGCRALFATHYHELAQLSETLPCLRNYTVQVLEDAGSIVFVHRVVPGAATKSYGIHVAQLAGVPAAVLERARVVLGELEAHHKLGPPQPKLPPRKKASEVRKREAVGPSLFGEE